FLRLPGRRQRGGAWPLMATVPQGRSEPWELINSRLVGRVLVVRHGQSEWNAAGRWQGWADISLSELGEEQARHAATRLADLDGARFTAVVASDLRRAVSTAEILASGPGIAAA